MTKEIYLKCKTWIAGTNTLVLGLLKRDVELHNIKEGEVLMLKVVERYNGHTRSSEDVTTSKKVEEENTGLRPERTGKSSLRDAGASTSNTNRRFNIN